MKKILKPMPLNLFILSEVIYLLFLIYNYLFFITYILFRLYYNNYIINNKRFIQ